jgi:hypothetical protein
MTDTELDRLDRLAAVHVMGYKFDSELRVWLTSDDKYVTNDWCPTHYIEQAWELLEKLDLTFNISKDKDHPEAPWIVWFDEYVDKFGIKRDATATTAPLAIVRACLLAVGINPNSAGVEATGVSLGESND